MIGWIVEIKITWFLSSARKSRHFYGTTLLMRLISLKILWADQGKNYFAIMSHGCLIHSEKLSALSVLNLRWKFLSTLRCVDTDMWFMGHYFWKYGATSSILSRNLTAIVMRCFKNPEAGNTKVAYHDVKAAARIIPCGPAIPPWMYCTVIYWSLTCKCNMGMMTGDAVMKCTEML